MRPRLQQRLALALTLVQLGGCAGGAAGSFAGSALELAGIKKPAELSDAQRPPRNIAIKLHAGPGLNSDGAGHPLALVARIYKLRQDAAFRQAPYEGFLNSQKEKELLGSDLLEVKEVLLIPGQRYEVVEKLSREAYFIGIVALFRAPARQRWRLAFAAGEAEQAGILVGMNACAMSLGAGSASAGGAESESAAAHCN